ncbi:hypothetical protein GGF50DRAFT_93136 [Schizophyllum commune]
MHPTRVFHPKQHIQVILNSRLYNTVDRQPLPIGPIRSATPRRRVTPYPTVTLRQPGAKSRSRPAEAHTHPPPPLEGAKSDGGLVSGDRRSITSLTHGISSDEDDEDELWQRGAPAPVLGPAESSDEEAATLWQRDAPASIVDNLESSDDDDDDDDEIVWQSNEPAPIADQPESSDEEAEMVWQRDAPNHTVNTADSSDEEAEMAWQFGAPAPIVDDPDSSDDDTEIVWQSNEPAPIADQPESSDEEAEMVWHRDAPDQAVDAADSSDDEEEHDLLWRNAAVQTVVNASVDEHRQHKTLALALGQVVNDAKDDDLQGEEAWQGNALDTADDAHSLEGVVTGWQRNNVETVDEAELSDEETEGLWRRDAPDQVSPSLDESYVEHQSEQHPAYVNPANLKNTPHSFSPPPSGARHNRPFPPSNAPDSPRAVPRNRNRLATPPAGRRSPPTADIASDRNESRSARIAKPNGECGKPSKGGYTLKDALQWETDRYDTVRKAMNKLVDTHLDAIKLYPEFDTDYEGHWPVRSFAANRLHYLKCARLKKSKASRSRYRRPKVSINLRIAASTPRIFFEDFVVVDFGEWRQAAKPL